MCDMAVVHVLFKQSHTLFLQVTGSIISKITSVTLVFFFTRLPAEKVTEIYGTLTYSRHGYTCKFSYRGVRACFLCVASDLCNVPCVLADHAAVDDHGATVWDYSRGKQLHYCMLIIASYIRQRAKEEEEEYGPLPEQLEDVGATVNGFNSLQVRSIYPSENRSN